MRFLSRMPLFLCRIIIGASGFVLLASQPFIASARDAPGVSVEAGTLGGVAEGNVLIFRGIPYAAPPVGPLRWRPPQSAPSWSGVRDATRFGSACMQPGGSLGMRTGRAPPPYDEDCLTLNIWAPAGARRAPVMVWLHGGSLRVGAGSLPYYDGAAFARSDVVLVTVNYRLGAFGFFAHPALTASAGADEPLASYGMMDQRAALQWVQRNIAAFGGDPDNVTLFGESAGGQSVLALMAAPSAKGLFHKAIVQSGGGWYPPVSLTVAEKTGIKLAQAAGLKGEPVSAAQLRAIPAASLAGLPALAMPVVDRRFFPDDPTTALANGRAMDIPMIVGANSAEDSLLDPKKGDIAYFRKTFGEKTLADAKSVYPDVRSDEVLIRALYRDSSFVGPARWTARLPWRRQPAFLYLFDHLASAQRHEAGAWHGSDVLFAFKTLADAYVDGPVDDADIVMASSMHACWVAFARTGQPSCAGKTWPAAAGKSESWMVFGRDGIAARPSLFAQPLDWQEQRFLNQSGLSE